MISAATKFEAKKNGFVPFPLKRVIVPELSMERMVSFQEAIQDFLKHSKENRANLAQVWNWIFISIMGMTSDEIWWALDGNKVICYFITTPQQNWTGAWELFINHGWAHKEIGSHGKRSYLAFIEKNAFDRGVKRITFLTQRNPHVFQRFLGKKWHPNGILFETTGDNNG